MPQTNPPQGTQQPSSSMPILGRDMPVSSVNADSRTVDVTWTTGAQVLRYDWMRDRNYLEELSTQPGAVRMQRLESGSAPLLNNHSRWAGLDGVLGVVSSASLNSASGTGQATLRFSKRDIAEPYFQDVQDGILRNVSVGYRTYRVEMIPPGQEGNDQWIYRATDWEPYEVSLVAIPADAGSTTRGEPDAQQRFYPCEFVERGAGNQPNGANASPQTEGAVMPTNENENNQNRATPAANTPAAPAAHAPATPPENGEGARAQAQAEERQRVQEIRVAVRSSTLDDAQALIDRFVDNGATVDAVRAELLRMLAERSDAARTRSQSNVRTVTDETDVRREAMSNALLHRINPRVELTDAGRQYRGMTLGEFCRTGLEEAGVDTRGLDRRQLAGMALGMGERGYNSTSDLPVVFGNVINRTLRDAYSAAPRSFSQWARQGTLNDFRAATRVMVDGALNLEKVNESGEYKYGKLVDGGETIQLGTYGKVVAFTRQMIINDDLSALERVPLYFGRAAANLELDLVYGALTGNTPMSDGNAIFHAKHGNLGAAAAISIASLSAGRTAMRVQKAPGDGTALNLAPSYLLVPAALETIAGQYTSNQYTPNQAGDQNPFFGTLTPIVEARLDAVSATGWYLVADPAMIDTVEYCYLDGEQGLYTEQALDFDVDGLKVKARLDFAAKAIDYRGLYKNPGQ
ncbi:prohead protease/major capsid protein fusion protein [Paraburkholderia sp. J41]|uniref:prohead protease/major capsid protein fusion protein n=1 Tax=Paraburkholderia sp. J41 TaxID=2805433 RepID=UPI002AC31877|nr:prohead protease/major capsid protein fusion protein [Paraburkholderia sp. J41]